MLSDKRDALGQRRVAVNLQIVEQDARSNARSVGILAAELARLGRGRLQAEGNPAFPSPRLGGHHMGATRMSDDPKRGVTDRACKVHGVSNLHIAGSSVFPTSGFSNPTLTIVAMTLRLAEALRAAKSTPMPS